MGKHEITPDGIDKLKDIVEGASENGTVDAVADVVESKLPAKARAAIYETGKWLGAVGTVGATAAGFLDGQPALYVASVASLLLAISSFIAKRHLSA
ncbi:hypothetical protein [Leifsonia aquatica]|uniref:hypothetical protein n=1 Tax=Leifsonia aquatica TaxID=144185 RepID=UPI00046AC1B3|nr:hypothetical protein [Leifsonia aquatica]